MNTEQQIQALQSEVRRLTQKVSDLEFKLNKDSFSNLEVYNKPVKFRFPNVYPKNDVSIATATTNSTGKIEIKDDTGTTRYIPYF